MGVRISLLAVLAIYFGVVLSTVNDKDAVDGLIKVIMDATLLFVVIYFVVSFVLRIEKRVITALGMTALTFAVFFVTTLAFDFQQRTQWQTVLIFWSDEASQEEKVATAEQNTPDTAATAESGRSNPSSVPALSARTTAVLKGLGYKVTPMFEKAQVVELGGALHREPGSLADGSDLIRYVDEAQWLRVTAKVEKGEDTYFHVQLDNGQTGYMNDIDLLTQKDRQRRAEAVRIMKEVEQNNNRDLEKARKYQGIVKSFRLPDTGCGRAPSIPSASASDRVTEKFNRRYSRWSSCMVDGLDTDLSAFKDLVRNDLDGSYSESQGRTTFSAHSLCKCKDKLKMIYEDIGDRQRSRKRRVENARTAIHRVNDEMERQEFWQGLSDMVDDAASRY